MAQVVLDRINDMLAKVEADTALEHSLVELVRGLKAEIAEVRAELQVARERGSGASDIDAVLTRLTELNAAIDANVAASAALANTSAPLGVPAAEAPVENTGSGATTGSLATTDPDPVEDAGAGETTESSD